MTAADADYGNDSAWDSTLAYAYDRMSRVENIDIDYDNPTGVADLAVDFAYTYDADGYRDTFSATIGASPNVQADFINGYTFDPLGRLTALTQDAQDSGTGYNVVADKRDEIKTPVPFCDSSFLHRAAGRHSLSRCAPPPSPSVPLAASPSQRDRASQCISLATCLRRCLVFARSIFCTARSAQHSLDQFTRRKILP